MKINIDTTVALKDEELKNIAKRKFKDKTTTISRTPVVRKKRKKR